MIRQCGAALLLCATLAAPALAGSGATQLAPVVASAGATHVERGERAQRWLQAARDPAVAAVRQMRLIERIYLRQNQPEKAIAMYREVLGRTRDTLLRNVVNARLARLAAWQPRDLDAALVELKRGLDENLAKVQ
jgi:predicted negative regulator of RcsB-dependent stress response